MRQKLQTLKVLDICLLGLQQNKRESAQLVLNELFPALILSNKCASCKYDRMFMHTMRWQSRGNANSPQAVHHLVCHCCPVQYFLSKFIQDAWQTKLIKILIKVQRR